MNYPAMGARIKATRKKLHLTQEQLAEIINVSPSFIGHVERGTRKSSLETLYALCEAMSVSADYLIGLSDEAVIKPILSDITQEEINAGKKLFQKLAGIR